MNNNNNNAKKRCQAVMIECEKCAKEFHMPFHFCCLKVCGEIESCLDDCKCGIYSAEFKDWVKNNQ